MTTLLSVMPLKNPKINYVQDVNGYVDFVDNRMRSHLVRSLYQGLAEIHAEKPVDLDLSQSLKDRKSGSQI